MGSIPILGKCFYTPLAQVEVRLVGASVYAGSSPVRSGRNEERSSSCKWLVLSHKKTEVLFLFEKLIFSDLLINEK